MSSKLPTKETQQPHQRLEKLKCWHCQGNHLKKDCPTVSNQSKSLHSKPQINKDKQHKLIRSFQKRFQNKKENINEITTASDNDSSDDQLNQFFSEFEKLMCEDEGKMSDLLHGPHAETATITEMFIKGFHVQYHVQIGKLKVAAVFQT